MTKQQLVDTRFHEIENLGVAKAFLDVMKSAWILKHISTNFIFDTLDTLQQEILFQLEKVWRIGRSERRR